MANNSLDFNNPAKRLEYLGKAEKVWSYLWYLGAAIVAVWLGIKVVPYITLAFENLFWMGVWALGLVTFLYVVTHKGLRKLVLRAFDHLIYYLDRLLRTHNPFIDAKISIDRLKKRLAEILEGQVNVQGAADKLDKKIKSFLNSRQEALTAAEVARDKAKTNKQMEKNVRRFARKAENYQAAADKLRPQYETARRIAIRLGEFYEMMQVSIEEQEDTLSLELELHNILLETKEATDAAYNMLSGVEKQEFDEAMEAIALTNAKLTAEADIFIQNTTTLVEMFQFEDEVKTEMAVQEFEKWMTAKQSALNNESMVVKQLNPVNAKSEVSGFGNDSFGLLNFDTEIKEKQEAKKK